MQPVGVRPFSDGAAFKAGMALERLGTFATDRDEAFPGVLWRRRLALGAAESLARLGGRRETAEEIRDARCFAGEGGDPGPAGTLYRIVRDIARPAGFEPRRMAAALGTVNVGQSNGNLPLNGIHLQAGVGESPVGCAARVAAEILIRSPAARGTALLAGDVALAKNLKWSAPVPLLVTEIKLAAVRAAPAGDGAWLVACYGAYERAARKASGAAVDLARRAETLKIGASVVRSKASAAAVDVLLTEDAVSPGMLARRAGMTDRAARRLCDRLVTLGVVRELTGRTSHRLYGL